MRKLQLENKAVEDLHHWLATDRKLLERILRLIEECRRSPFQGTGKPEPLKGNRSGFWSRRIDQEHRLVYKATEEFIAVHSMRGHYDD